MTSKHVVKIFRNNHPSGAKYTPPNTCHELWVMRVLYSTICCCTLMAYCDITRWALVFSPPQVEGLPPDWELSLMTPQAPSWLQAPCLWKWSHGSNHTHFLWALPLTAAVIRYWKKQKIRQNISRARHDQYTVIYDTNTDALSHYTSALNIHSQFRSSSVRSIPQVYRQVQCFR